MKPSLDLVLQIYYNQEQNYFEDEDGFIIEDIFNIITPLDLYMFHHDKSYNCFRMTGDPNVMVVILCFPDDMCGSQEIPELYFDLGDDWERIDRYEKARMSGNLI